MSRTISSGLRQALESPQSGDYPVILMVLDHGDAPDGPIYVCSDNCDYMYGGNRYVGVSLQIELLSDDLSAPRASVGVVNVDRSVSDFFQAIETSPDVSLTVLSTLDFDASPSGEPKTKNPIGTPTVQYQALHLRLANVSADVMTVSGDLVSYDYGSEQWPGLTATQGRLPGLYR